MWELLCVYHSLLFMLFIIMLDNSLLFMFHQHSHLAIAAIPAILSTGGHQARVLIKEEVRMYRKDKTTGLSLRSLCTPTYQPTAGLLLFDAGRPPRAYAGCPAASESRIQSLPQYSTTRGGTVLV